MNYLLECDVCGGFLNDPVLCRLGHTFCFDCLNKWAIQCSAKNVPLKCPSGCNVLIDITNLPRSFKLTEYCHSIEIECTQHCGWRGANIVALQSHIENDCTETEINCPVHNLCKIKRHNVVTHITESHKIIEANFERKIGWLESFSKKHGSNFVIKDFSVTILHSCGIKHGIVKFDDGNIYSGELHNNLAHGVGTYYDFDNNLRYYGHFRNGMKHGFMISVQMSSNEMLFYGEYFNNCKYFGRLFVKNSHTYTGYFSEDRYNGYGTITNHKTNAIYCGEWCDGFMDGAGVLTIPYKSVFVGSFKFHKKCGFGVITLSNGDIYEGDWMDSKLHGDVSVKTNQHLYVGHFLNGKKYGYGSTFHRDDFTTETHFYVDNIKCNLKTGVFALEFGKYSGNYLGDYMWGVGVCEYNDRSVYTGEWRYNMRHGHGILVYPDGFTYDGYFRNDLRSGFGTYTDKKGYVVYSGLYLNGKRVKK